MENLVRIYDPIARKVIEIPASELAPGMALVELEGEGLVWFPAGAARPGPIRHEPFSEDIRHRLRQIKLALDPVYPLSIEEWEDGFRRDANPAKEIAIWWRIADIFHTYTEGWDMSHTALCECFQVLTACACATPETIRQVVAPKALSSTHVDGLVTAFYSNSPAQPTIHRTADPPNLKLLRRYERALVHFVSATPPVFWPLRNPTQLFTTIPLNSRRRRIPAFDPVEGHWRELSFREPVDSLRLSLSIDGAAEISAGVDDESAVLMCCSFDSASQLLELIRGVSALREPFDCAVKWELRRLTELIEATHLWIQNYTINEAYKWNPAVWKREAPELHESLEELQNDPDAWTRNLQWECLEELPVGLERASLPLMDDVLLSLSPVRIISHRQLASDPHVPMPILVLKVRKGCSPWFVTHFLRRTQEGSQLCVELVRELLNLPGFLKRHAVALPAAVHQSRIAIEAAALDRAYISAHESIRSMVEPAQDYAALFKRRTRAIQQLRRENMQELEEFTSPMPFPLEFLVRSWRRSDSETERLQNGLSLFSALCKLPTLLLAEFGMNATADSPVANEFTDDLKGVITDGRWCKWLKRWAGVIDSAPEHLQPLVHACNGPVSELLDRLVTLRNAAAHPPHNFAAVLDAFDDGLPRAVGCLRSALASCVLFVPVCPVFDSESRVAHKISLAMGADPRFGVRPLAWSPASAEIKNNCCYLSDLSMTDVIPLKRFFRIRRSRDGTEIGCYEKSQAGADFFLYLPSREVTK